MQIKEQTLYFFLHSPQMTERLMHLGYLEDRNQKPYLAPKGKEIGGELMPLKMNLAKKAKITERQRALAQRLKSAGLF